MNPNCPCPRPARCHGLVALTLLLLGASSPLAGQSLYLDVNGSAAGSGVAGSVAWDTTSVVWNSAGDGTGTVSAWSGTVATAVLSAGSDAVGAYTVNVGGTMSLGGLAVEEGTPLVTGGTLLFGQNTDFGVAGGSVATINSTVDGGGHAWSKSGAGTLVFAGTATSLGSLAIDGGTWRLGQAGALPAATAVSVAAGATFDLNNLANTIGSLAGAGTVLTGGNALNVGGNNGTTEFSGSIAGSAGVNKQGSGTLTLSGASTYDGVTQVQNGRLVIANAQALGSTAGGTTASTGRTLELVNVDVAGEALTLTGGTLAVAAGTTSSWSGTVSTALTPNFAIDGTLTLSSAISNAAIRKSGVGTLILSGSNTYANATIVSGGTLVVANPDALGNTVGRTSVNPGATLDLRDVSVAGEFVTLSNGTLAVSTGIGALGGTVSLSSLGGTVSVTGTRLTLSGAIEGNNGILTKTGAGTLVLSGPSVVTAGTIIDAGVVQLGGNEIISNAGSFTVHAGGTLRTGAFTETFDSVNGDGMLELAGGTLTLTGTSAIGTLHVTADSVLNFGANLFSVENFIIDAGVTLSASNEFLAANWWTDASMTNLVARNVSGVMPYNQVTITSFGASGDQTGWDDSDFVTPVPEPGASGAVLLAGALALLASRRRRPGT